MYKIDRRGGGHKSFSRNIPDNEMGERDNEMGERNNEII